MSRIRISSDNFSPNIVYILSSSFTIRLIPLNGVRVYLSGMINLSTDGARCCLTVAFYGNLFFSCTNVSFLLFTVTFIEKDNFFVPHPARALGNTCGSKRVSTSQFLEIRGLSDPAAHVLKS